jgi:predicted DNA-binding transcriptional regulator AlpA
MLLTIKDLVELTRLSRPSVYRAIQRGRLPRPIHLTPRTSRWVRDEVDFYLGRMGRGN